MSEKRVVVAQDQLESMKAVVDQNQRGQYFIDYITMVDISSEKLRMLNWLLRHLVEAYPDYVWQQSEALDPNVRGITISWYPKSSKGSRW